MAFVETLDLKTKGFLMIGYTELIYLMCIYFRQTRCVHHKDLISTDPTCQRARVFIGPLSQGLYNWRYVTSAWWKCLCSFVIRSCRPGRCWSRRKLSPELKRLTFQMTFLSMDHSVCTTGQLGYIKDVGAEYKWDNLRQAPMMSSTMPTPRLST